MPIQKNQNPGGLFDSSKTLPRILIFWIAVGADYSYEVKNNEI